MTTFWVHGQDWRVCDLPDADGSRPTVFGPARGRGIDLPQLAISTTGSTDGASARLVAGGLLPWPVEQIQYQLPDGSRAVARFVTSDDDPEQTWWVMAQDVPESALEDPAAVTISVTGATAEALRVPWEKAQRAE